MTCTSAPAPGYSILQTFSSPSPFICQAYLTYQVFYPLQDLPFAPHGIKQSFTIQIKYILDMPARTNSACCIITAYLFNVYFLHICRACQAHQARRERPVMLARWWVLLQGTHSRCLVTAFYTVKRVCKRGPSGSIDTLSEFNHQSVFYSVCFGLLILC